MRIFWMLFLSWLIGCSDYELESDKGKTYSYKDEKEKYCNGNKPKDKILSMANDGDANQQLAMGLIYDAGYCGIKDLKIAESWYLKSAGQNYIPAQAGLGAFYLSNEYYKKYKKFNIKQAEYWLNRAINQNDSQAMFYKSALYCDNTYGSEDMEKCSYWLKQSAKFGNQNATQILSN